MVLDDDDDPRDGAELPWDRGNGNIEEPPTAVIHQAILRLAQQWRANRFTLFEELHDEYVKGQDEVLSDGLWFSLWADSRIPCWWPGDLRAGLGQGFHPLAGEGLLQPV
jgi:hypothetical protein